MVAFPKKSLILGWTLLALSACSGGAKEAPEETGTPPQNSVLSTDASSAAISAPVDRKDKIKKYAEKVGSDAATIEKTFDEVLGATPAGKFNETWFKFFIATDPAFAGMESFLPNLWAQVWRASMPSEGLTRGGGSGGDGGGDSKTNPDNDTGTGGDGSWAVGATYVTGTGGNGSASGDGSWAVKSTVSIGLTEPSENSPAIGVDGKVFTGFNGILRLIQSRLLEDAAVFGLPLAAAGAGSFPLPENFFGSAEAFDAEAKEIFTKLLYSASMKADGEFFSFFQFAGQSLESERRHHDYITAISGKFAWVPAATNVLVPPRNSLREHGTAGR